MQGGRVILDAGLLRQLRQARGLSQEDLASACFRQHIRVSVSTIKRAECGRAVLFRIARELARFFDVPVNRLTGPGAPAVAVPVRGAGRAAELAQFAGALDQQTLQHRGLVMLLQGEAGIGKSHLLAQCIALARERHVDTTVQHIQNQGGRPWYHPLLGVVRVLLGQGDDTGPLSPAQFADLCQRFACSDAECVHLAFFLGQNLAPPLQQLQESLDYAARHAGQNQLLLRLLAHYGRPLLIAIEDVHWADLHLLLVLRHLAAGIGRLPVMLLLNSRPDQGAWEDVWGSGLMNTPQLTVLLKPLDEAESAALAGQFTQVPSAFRASCIALADGNPLFLNQLLLNYAAGAAALPQSIRNHIGHKLAQLAPPDRAALEAASVIGERFGLDLVRDITGDASYGGAALAAGHLIALHDDGEGIFCHALIQQAVYASLDVEMQRQLHGKAALWYRDRHPALYAHHLEQARQRNATQAYVNAATAMVEQSNYIDALTLVDQGLALVPHGAQRYQPVLLKARLLKLLNLPEKSILYLLEAVELADGDAQRCEALCELAEACVASNRYADARKALAQIEADCAAPPMRAGARIGALRRQLGLDGSDAGAPDALPQMADAAGLQDSLLAAFQGLALRNAAAPVQAGSRRREIAVGVLHSQTGFLRELEAGVLRATLLAFQEINDQGGLSGCRIVPVVADGRSSETVFMEQAARLIGRDDIVTLFGCSTSSSRRRVRPLVDDNEHLLFYPFQHEGIEASPHIAYVGPAPNQQALPAVDWLCAKGHASFLLIGSHYIYPVVTNDIVKDRIVHQGGTVADELYFGLGCRDFQPAVDAIERLAPDAVILTIVGLESNFALLQQLHRTGRRRPTILSLVLSEDDLANIPADYTVGIYTVYSYFQNIEHPLNQDFVRRYKQRFGDRGRIGGYMESAYVGVFLWARAVQKAGSLDRRAIKQAMKGISHVGPGGIAYMDEDNNYVWRHVRVAQVGRDGAYHVAWNSPRPVRPEPYPTGKSVDEWHAYIRQLRERWGGRWESPPSK